MYISLHIYIYRKGWLTNRSSLLIILNLVSKLFAVWTLFPLSFHLQPAFSLLFLNEFYCCRWLFHHHRWCSIAGQPSTSCCCWCLSSTTTASTCRACLYRSFAPYGNTHSSYRSFIKHPPNCFIETYEHKLSLLANVDEALSPWSRCFSLRWRLSVVSFILCFWHFCWFFLYNQPFFSSLEATRSTYFECITLLSLRGCVASQGRLFYHALCLAHSCESACISI